VFQLSLRQRVLFWIVAINVAVVGGQVALLTNALGRASELGARERAGELVGKVRKEIVPGGVNSALLLQWPSWQQYADVLICDRNLAELAPGRWGPLGVALNPLGRVSRGVEFDEQAVFSAMRIAIQTGAPVDGVQGGRVVPIDTAGSIWGACWLKDRPEPRAWVVARYFLPIFALSSALLCAGTFVVLKRFVLDPVAELESASSAVARGELSVRARARSHGDELGRLVQSFNHMAERVEGFNAQLAREVQRATEQARAAESAAMTQRRLAAMGELAAGIAHEINNPLGGLINAAESLQRESMTSERREQYFALLRSGLERIRATVGQLLRLAPRHADSGSLSGPVSLVECARDAAALLRHRARELGVTIEFEAFGRTHDACEWDERAAADLARVPSVEGQAPELAQALLNLLVNSLDAHESSSRADPAESHGAGRDRFVRIHFQVEPGELWVRVEDNGPGVDPRILPRISDLFFTTKEPGRGTGLGLALVHKAVTASGGRVCFAPRKGGGLEATLSFALGPPRAAPRSAGPAAPPPSEEGGAV
jgi:signal transduction histidine kinase